ncbi:MAG: class I SAM-dependent methyltransferase, partial [Actinomycetota bacterium]|nr:class I SAM-dependent methyltransferase [Actinomycetota bacterium]
AEDWWVVSDLGGLDGRTRPLPADHVLGVGGASTTLAQLTVRPPVGRALDLGTGCGVQGLHLSRHSDAVVATDVLPRALAMARLTADLSGVALDLRRGSFFAPVAEERFDLVVSNPPFVISPEGGYAYRDSGLPLDDVGRRLVGEAPGHLAPGGWCQLLANWVHRRGEDWRERVGGWLPATGCDAWVVQREVQDPGEYVSLWLHDSGEAAAPDYPQRYDRWLRGLEDAHVEAVGFGWITLHASGAARPRWRLEHWPHPVEQPLGAEVQDFFARADWLRRHGSDDALLAARLLVAPDVRQEQVGRPGAEDPEHVLLRASRGLRRAREVDTVTAALVGACEGTLPVAALLEAIALLLDEEPAMLRAESPGLVRELVADGFLRPAEPQPTA